MSELQSLGRLLVTVGMLFVAAGLLLLSGFKLSWLGHLPGDIAIRRDGFSFYFPLMSCLVISALVSAIFWLIGRFRP